MSAEMASSLRELEGGAAISRERDRRRRYMGAEKGVEGVGKKTQREKTREESRHTNELERLGLCRIMILHRRCVGS